MQLEVAILENNLEKTRDGFYITGNDWKSLVSYLITASLMVQH